MVISRGNKISKKSSPSERSPHAISEAVAEVIESPEANYVTIERYIRETIPPVHKKYLYPGENCINPGYQDIQSVNCPLQKNEKRIWALRSDFILVTGVKNAYQKEYGYTGFADSFSPELHRFLNWDDRYGHPSLTLAEGHYDGSAFYAGYLCQREEFLQVYLVSGRFERTDLSTEQTQILEAYIASRFQTVYGNQSIVFDYGDSEMPSYHATFFSDGKFDASNPQRRYDCASIRMILLACPNLPLEQGMPEMDRPCLRSN